MTKPKPFFCFFLLCGLTVFLSSCASTNQIVTVSKSRSEEYSRIILDKTYGGTALSVNIIDSGSIVQDGEVLDPMLVVYLSDPYKKIKKTELWRNDSGGLSSSRIKILVQTYDKSDLRETGAFESRVEISRESGIAYGKTEIYYDVWEFDDKDHLPNIFSDPSLRTFAGKFIGSLGHKGKLVWDRLPGRMVLHGVIFTNNMCLEQSSEPIVTEPGKAYYLRARTEFTWKQVTNRIVLFKVE